MFVFCDTSVRVFFLHFTFRFIHLAGAFIQSKFQVKQNTVQSLLCLLWMWHRWHLCRSTGTALLLRGNGAVEVVGLVVLMHSLSYSHLLGMRTHAGFSCLEMNYYLSCKTCLYLDLVQFLVLTVFKKTFAQSTKWSESH